MSAETETLDWNKLPALYKALGGKSAGRAVVPGLKKQRMRTRKGSLILVCFNGDSKRAASPGGFYRRVLRVENGVAICHPGKIRSWILIQ